MFKKGLLVFILLFIIGANLALWPYLYKQSKGVRSDIETSEQTVKSETQTASQRVDTEEEALDEEETTGYEEQLNEETETEEVEFKVVEIK
ncbi:hypothetical protein IM538_21665 [Cytobacillus suaedae]|nr:hypothetical protein IM538_21665 [Cytobacillus suaedae]